MNDEPDIKDTLDARRKKEVLEEFAFLSEFRNSAPMLLRDTESFGKWLGEYAESRDVLNRLYESYNDDQPVKVDLNVKILNLTTMIGNLVSWVNMLAFTIEAVNKKVNEMDGHTLSEEEREVVSLIMDNFRKELERVNAGTHIDYGITRRATQGENHP